MFLLNLKIAWRNLIKNKMLTLINLIGLIIGMTCFILIALYIQFELSYDSQHENADNIYRVVQQQKGNEFRGSDYFAVSPRPLGIALKKDFSEVKSVTNLNVWGSLLIRDKKSFSERGLYADEEVFDVFTIPVLEGQGKKALEDPSTILLTQSLAKKIFGEESAMNKIISYNNKNLIVRGIIADPPKNQHFTYSYIASIKMGTQYKKDIVKWVSNNYHTYIKLADGSNHKNLEQKMMVYEKITKPDFLAVGFHFSPEYKLQPLKDIHLYSNINFEIANNNDIRYIYFFVFIAVIILVLASINYMNLTTAKSAQRAKEVGVSKVLGARKENLLLQFLGESFLFTLFSFGIALVITFMLLPQFNKLLNKDIPFTIMGNWWILVIMILFALLIAGLSGLYPAVFLSGVNPAKALKGDFLQSPKKGSILRNTLVTSQFAIAIVLAIGSIIIHQQLGYIQNKKLGYSRKQVIHVPYWEKEISQKEQVIRTELLNHPKIQKVSFSTQLPMNQHNQGPIDQWEGNLDKKQLFTYRSYIDYNFIDLFEMELVEGRDFSKEFPTDSAQAYILNQAAIKKLGWDSAVGKKFNDGIVIGVVKDFHLQTFDLAIEPLYMTMRKEDWDREHGEIIMKIDMNNFEETRAFIEKTLKTVSPIAPYEVKFMEDSYAQLYDKETRLGKAFNIFSLLALFIAGMGLFGLVSFHVLQRTKEIGIRKILGCSVIGIVQVLLKDFLKLILIAILIATPVAYYTMNNWLQGFVYRIEIQWWVFVLVGVITLMIAFITTSYQSIKAALANPVNCIKTE